MAVNNKFNEYLFEIVERIYRIEFHLSQINDQFKISEDDVIIESYRDVIRKYFEVSIHISNLIRDEKYSSVVQSLIDIKINLIELHSELHHLPRPSEPVELKRFNRIIGKHVVNFNKSKLSLASTNGKISIYMSEQTSEMTYYMDPLLEIKIEKVNSLIDKFNTTHDTSIKMLEVTDDIENLHISIPRIDSSNPCRWPTLMHEVSHNLMDIIDKDIFNDFKEFLDEIQLTFVNEQSFTINIKSWLTECWCDLFATLVMGPCFWFSQYSAFIFQPTINEFKSSEYPPNIFRLKLIRKILNHRFPNLLTNSLRTTMDNCEGVIYTQDPNQLDFTTEPDIRQLYLYFQDYFVRHFFKVKNNNESGENFYIPSDIVQPIIKYSESIKIEIIEKLVISLEEGYPIPGRKISDDNLTERPTFIQEILLAAWLYRNTKLSAQVLDILASCCKQEAEIDLQQEIKKISAIFEKFDKSILRSIQVSEWFDLLDDEPDSLPFEITENNLPPSGLLSDNEILGLLKSGELKVIPIFNLTKQLGSSSFDIRLGTSFQIYLSSNYGIVDFTDSSTDAIIKRSQTIDLDFLEPLTISPRQFVLGHSMEYLKFPSNFAGQVEGRSSFARLGLQIHMTAGFVDPGFEGVLTFEIFNAGPHPITLYPGLRIAQLRFIPINQPKMLYGRNLSAKYNGLLYHHDSMQFKDYEVSKIKAAKEKK